MELRAGLHSGKRSSHHARSLEFEKKLRMKDDVFDMILFQDFQTRWRWKVEQQTGKRRGQIWPVATPAIHDRMVMVKSIVVIPGLIFPGKIFVQVGHRKLDNRLRAAMSGKPLINWGYGASYRNMGDRQVSGKRLQKNSQRQCYQQAAYCECREGKMLKGARCWLCPNFLLSCRFCMYYFLQPG